MELTLEQVKAWENDPVTQKIRAMIGEGVDETRAGYLQLVLSAESSSLLGTRIAYDEGRIEGAKAIDEMCYSLKYEIREDEDE